MTITDEDLEWLANINTRPGPGVGEKIDPTKPGPPNTPTSADAIEGMREALANIDIRGIVRDSLNQMRRTGESHEMCARWISEEIRQQFVALALPDSKPDNQGGA